MKIDRRPAFLIGIMLFVLTFAVYAQVRHHAFVDFDDRNTLSPIRMSIRD